MKTFDDQVLTPSNQNLSCCKALDPMLHNTNPTVWFYDSFPLHANTTRDFTFPKFIKYTIKQGEMKCLYHSNSVKYQNHTAPQIQHFLHF